MLTVKERVELVQIYLKCCDFDTTIQKFSLKHPLKVKPSRNDVVKLIDQLRTTGGVL